MEGGRTLPPTYVAFPASLKYGRRYRYRYRNRMNWVGLR